MTTFQIIFLMYCLVTALFYIGVVIEATNELNLLTFLKGVATSPIMAPIVLGMLAKRATMRGSK